MSLTTRCPACATIFKVVSDQLRISEGWVRCGQCDEVFDANTHLQTTPKPLVREPFVQKPIEIPAQYDWGGVSGVTADVLVPAPPEPELPASEVSIDAAFGVVPIPKPTTDIASAIEDVLPVETVDSPAFMRDADVRYLNGWQGRARGVWLTCACFLALLLPFQVLMQERDRIAAGAPDLKLLLDPLCGVIGCKILPMQMIDAVVIESSAFSKMQANVYELSFTIKSTALIDIATPSLELTLTDGQDRPLVRRVFSPAELQRSNSDLVTGVEWTGAKTLVLNPSAAEARVAGYRILAFYP
jgi:predicted Zn finger-like uncharacterized protein